MIARTIGRLASRPSQATVRVEPKGAVARFAPGRFVALIVSQDGWQRDGVAEVRAVDAEQGTLTFSAPLNALVPAAADGDYIVEWWPPCTKCRCRRCSGEGDS